MKEQFYNEIFSNDLDMEFWCETYKVANDMFDSKEYDEDGKVHVTFSSRSVPLYHKEMVKKERMNECKPRVKSRPKKNRSENPYDEFINR